MIGTRKIDDNNLSAKVNNIVTRYSHCAGNLFLFSPLNKHFVIVVLYGQLLKLNSTTYKAMQWQEIVDKMDPILAIALFNDLK